MVVITEVDDIHSLYLLSNELSASAIPSKQFNANCILQAKANIILEPFLQASLPNVEHLKIFRFVRVDKLVGAVELS